ncbi:unnamed protein product [Adineta ricciae]|uniref:Uncharacterized protein n=1 Tax=Adineta ricciae TaxID=249248 RepID=A0A815CLL9_ADIRI|nr:unnamed protein product [Adineta ricciae]CAF1286825.1 unnamed protein product [Adineta ricciae]
MALSSTWTDRIAKLSGNKTLKSRTCKVFVKHPERDICQCGRLKPSHSYETLDMKTLAEPTDQTREWNEFPDTAAVPINVYGQLSSNGPKFVRCDNRTKPVDLYNLILDDCNNQKPNLLISAYGGAKFFTLSERIEKDFVTGIIDLATRADAWILTAGVNNGVANLIGEGISQYRVLKQHPKSIICIGLTQWGSLTERTRLELKQTTPNYPEQLTYIRQAESKLEVDSEDLELNHTHYIILDNGQLRGHLSDTPRQKFVSQATQDGSCYGITIIVEGGANTLEVIQNDLDAKRPVVLIQKSGRISDVLASLIQLTSSADRTKSREPIQAEVEEHLDKYFTALKGDIDRTTRIKQILEIMKTTNRYLLHVYQLDGEKSMSETMFQAIFSAYKDNPDDAKRERLLDLSIRWNFLDGAKQLLEVNNTRREKSGQTKDKPLLGKLFKQALEQNRPSFVDYFLRCGYDPRDLPSVMSQTSSEEESAFINVDTANKCQKFVLSLYNHIKKHAYEHHNKESIKLFYGPRNELNDVESLNRRLRRWLGSYVDAVYVTKPKTLLPIPMTRQLFIKYFNNQVAAENGDAIVQFHDGTSKIRHSIDHIATVGITPDNVVDSKTDLNYSQQEMLRDLFLWSVFMDLSLMSKTILIHMQERICASLIAAKVFKAYADETPITDLRDRLNRQVVEFENYSAKCVDTCYEVSEPLACQLLMRAVPSFGNVTCMQVAISGENAKFLETACFDHVLNQIWYYKLALSTKSLVSKVRLFGSILTLGLPAPYLLEYRSKEDCYSSEILTEEEKNAKLSEDGIIYDIYDDQPSFLQKFTSFHQTPVVKMCYHVISYILFLLIFSYMMLYHFDSLAVTNGTLHWTEYAVIIVVTTMFLEEIRQIVHDLHTKMLEKWNTTTHLVLTKLANPFYALPFLLFYLGILLRYAFGNASSVLSAARILMAFDLELWYLRSLKFVIALKFLGPKLFMLRNMLRDLAAFVYMIFIAIAAYGVVSRALFMYKQVPFTGRGIFENIFYPPYWFIYGNPNDTTTLDNIIHDGNSSFIAEATATHVLLAFHMLFINILLLNLLIAVFTRTIDEVQEHTEFYWRFQRYSFVREYFERPWLAYPPLIIIPHLWIVGRALWKKCCSSKHYDARTEHHSVTTPIFKMIPLNRKIFHERWDKFENAATYSYARSVINFENTSNSNQQRKSAESTTTVQTHEDMQRQINEITIALKRLTESLVRSDANAQSIS